MSDTPKTKLSAADVITRLDQLQRVQALSLSPQPMYVYKPRGEADGAALKLQLRLVPKFGDKGYVSEVDGGLFLELAAQVGKGEGGFARFGWQDESLVVAKLGIPDITAFLLALRSRVTGKPIPEELRAKNDDKGVTVSRFHKFEQETTVIEMKFDKTGSFLSVSKSRELRRSIKLSLCEEIQLEAYLQLALNACHQVGQR